MNTKEAIKFLNCRDRHLLYGKPTQYASELNEAIDHIIKVAQRGEKYKKIVKGMVEFSESKAFKLHIDENELWKFKLKKIIAEYFPTPSTNFTEKVMEKIKKEVI